MTSDKEDSGNITLTLNSTANYTVGSEAEGIILVVDDDYRDDVPRVSIALTSETDSEDGEIDEGQIIDITISVATDDTASVTAPVNVTIDVQQEGGDYIAFRVPRVHRLTTDSGRIRIFTLNDNLEEDDGTITVSITETDGGELYR